MAEVLVVRAVKFVHERGILCAELVPTEKFVHESAVLCAELFPTEKFAHERGYSVRRVSSWEEVGSGMPNFAHESAVLSAELFPTENFAHERGVLCAEFHLGKRLAPACRTMCTKVLF